MRNLLILIFPFLLGLAQSGCTVYRVDVQQGNTLELEQVNQLEQGMSREQVAFLLGTPLVRDPFHPDRWDYVYSFKPGGGKLKSRHLTLYFENDTLANVGRSQFEEYTRIYNPTGSGRPDTASQSLSGGNRGPAPPPRGGGLPSP